MQDYGLTDTQASFLNKDDQYGELMTLDPGEDPMASTEEPTRAEQAQFDNLYADFMDVLYGRGEASVLKMVRTTPEIFQGVSQAAFTILRGVWGEFQRKEGEEVTPAILFGEGGMINTAVDEVFSIAKANKLPGSDDINQYAAAQMDMMRRVGEYIQQRQDDGAVEEAQDLMTDIEIANNPNVEPGVLPTQDRQSIEALSVQDEAVNEARNAQIESESMPPPGAAPEQGPGGLI